MITGRQCWYWNLFVQVEETTREREERLKGWSAFLGRDNPDRQNTAKPAEGATTTEPTEPSSTAEPEQQQETHLKEQEVDSTDSSLAGSDEDEA